MNYGSRFCNVRVCHAKQKYKIEMIRFQKQGTRRKRKSAGRYRQVGGREQTELNEKGQHQPGEGQDQRPSKEHGDV